MMAAPLIIRDQRDQPDQQEVIVMLADFSFTPPEQIFEKLKKGGGMPAMAGGGQGMAGMKGMDMKGPGMKGSDMKGKSGSAMAPGMVAGKPDLNDVSYDAFLA